jgi:hypothetical protein
MLPFPERFARGDSPWRFDLAERRLISRSQASDIYGGAVHCVAKRQLSRRQLRALGLGNALNEHSTGAQSSACRLRSMLKTALKLFCGPKDVGYLLEIDPSHVHELVRSLKPS